MLSFDFDASEKLIISSLKIGIVVNLLFHSKSLYVNISEVVFLSISIFGNCFTFSTFVADTMKFPLRMVSKTNPKFCPKIEGAPLIFKSLVYQSSIVFELIIVFAFLQVYPNIFLVSLLSSNL